MKGGSTLIDVVQNPRPLACVFEKDVYPKPIFLSLGHVNHCIGELNLDDKSIVVGGVSLYNFENIKMLECIERSLLMKPPSLAFCMLPFFSFPVLSRYSCFP